MARTKAAIDDAFVQLVLEQGYDQVAVEDITDRADLARATFYAHYLAFWRARPLLTGGCTAR